MSDIVYVNGSYVAREDAKISIFDRGFLFADGVYEVCAVLDGALIDNDAHLDRLKRSLAAIAIAPPLSRPQIVEMQRALVARNNVREGLVYMQATRGVADRDFVFPAQASASFVAFTQKKAIIDAPAAATGVAVVTTPDLRWARRDIKSVALLPQVLAKQFAREKGAAEAFMVEDGFITEGSSSTAFIITRAGEIVTRPLSQAVLPGCTRRALMALAREHGAPVLERAFRVEEALVAAECFYASATAFVMPVVSIDGRPIGDGKPGPRARRLRELYIEAARASAQPAG